MTVRYFDSRGRWIAFRPSKTDRNLFSPRGKWIGWLAWGDDDVCGVGTKRYLGTVVGDRLLSNVVPPPHPHPVTPSKPFIPFIPSAGQEAFHRHARWLPGGRCG
jgi:hypothetical protein